MFLVYGILKHVFSLYGSNYYSFQKMMFYVLYYVTLCFFSSPEPKAHGELIVYQSIRRPSVCPSVNIFKLEYLRNQWANRNQILSEASLGRGKDALGFGPDRIGTLVSMATDSSHRVIMGKIL